MYFHAFFAGLLGVSLYARAAGRTCWDADVEYSECHEG